MKTTVAMRMLIHLILLVIVAVIISGCATQTPSVGFVTGSSQTRDDRISYFIQPLHDANAAKDRQNYPEAAAVATSAVESAFLQLGKRVVADSTGDTEVTGVVTAYYAGSFAGRYTTVGLDLKAVEKKTGRVIWKATHIKSTRWDYKYDPALLAREVAGELLNKVFASSEKQ